MINKLQKLFYVLITIVGLNACEKIQDADTAKSSANKPAVRKMVVMNNENFPSTDRVMLDNYIHNDLEIICPFEARLVASYELSNGGYQLLNSLRNGEAYFEGGREYHLDYHVIDTTWSLTTYPRVILDYSRHVKYYEFGLIEHNEITGTITVHAKREVPRAIAYMFPYVLPYSHTEYEYYIGQYPHRVFYDGTMFRPVDGYDGEFAFNDVDMNDYWHQVEAQADADQLADLARLHNHPNTPDAEEELETEIYWTTARYAINEVTETLNLDLPCVAPPSYSQDDNPFIESLKHYLGTNEYCRDYTAKPYRTAPIQKTRWKCACGPSGLAWIYRGLYNTYPPQNGHPLPLHGDQTNYHFRTVNQHSFYDFRLDNLDNLHWIYFNDVMHTYLDTSLVVDYGLTFNFFRNCIPVKWQGSWEFALLPCRLSWAFAAATNNAYTISNDVTATQATEYIQHDLPVMLLFTNWEHYLVAYGYGGISSTAGGPIKKKNLYFLVTDNGYKIGNNSYKPYWRGYEMCEYYYCIVNQN